MPGKIEHKFISLAEFKAISEGSGGFSGYMSKWGELDDGGDIVAQGAHLDTLEQFKRRGFATNNHDWSFGGGLIGYILDAKEDEEGTWVDTRFHSTPDAQNVRIKAQERQAAGKDVFLSMGYEPAIPPLIIFPKDYAVEIPKYSKPELIEANLAKAARFPKVRILLKDHLYEAAVVGVPMLGSAEVSQVKSAPTAPQADVKGMFEDELAERNNSYYALCDVLGYVLHRIRSMASLAASTGLVFDPEPLIVEALQEFTGRVLAAEIGAEQGYVDEMAVMGLKDGLNDDLPLASHLDIANAAMKGLTTRLQSRLSLLTKEGRAISTQRRERMQSLHDAMSSVLSDLADLLKETEPKPKEEDEEQGKSARRELVRYLALEAARMGVPIA